jgi:hypothetical protein
MGQSFWDEVSRKRKTKEKDIFRFPLENETQKSKLKLALSCHAGETLEGSYEFFSIPA